MSTSWAVVLEVSGMTCAACSARVERELRALPGIEASVNVATGRASVWSAPLDQLPPARDAAPAGASTGREERPGAPPTEVLAVLVAAVNRAGYQATPPPGSDLDPGQRPGTAARIDAARLDAARAPDLRLDANRTVLNLTVLQRAAPDRAVLNPAAPDRAVADRAASDPTGTTRSAEPDPQERHRRSLWRRLLVSLVLVIPLGDLSIAAALTPSARFPGWQWVLLGLALPVATWCAWPFHRAALLAARHRGTTMDTLISLGVVTATLLSAVTVLAHPHAPAVHGWGWLLHPGGAIYFDVVGGVTVFVLIGRVLESQARRRTGGALRALASAGAQQARVLDDEGAEHLVPAARLVVGDRFVVRPGERVATDGVVLRGHAAVDASSLTGESRPVEVSTGDHAVGGTLALDGRLEVTATRVGRDTQMAQLVELVERAQTGKAAIQRLADRVSGVFVPIVLVLAAATWVGWAVLSGSPERAFSPALAVLIVACPCALGLATPMALLAASDRAAREGMFVTSAQALESARRIDTVVLDKTGTVTVGRMSVRAVRAAPGQDVEQVLRLAGALENASAHPVAVAVHEHARARCGQLPDAADFRHLDGLGAIGRVDGHNLLVGSPRLLAERDVLVPAELSGWIEREQPGGLTPVLVAVDGRAVLALTLADTVKPSARPAIERLHALGLRTVLLTGDQRATAEAVGAEVGVDEVIAEVLPAQKAAVVADLQARGHRVAMVGDGVNDGPALAQADLGLALMSGTDVARAAADLLLLSDDLRVVPDAVELARATLSTIRGNLFWAFGYNVAAIPLAVAGLLNPVIAAAAMAFSSLFVVSNSLRLDHHVEDLDPEPGP